MRYDLLALDMGEVEIRRCPYTDMTEVKHRPSGKTAHISQWRQPNEKELVYVGNKLLREVELDLIERRRRAYFWLGCEAETI